MRDLQEIVAAQAEQLVDSGAERGPQVAAYVDGRAVVDVAVGLADPATGRAVEPDTLFYNWSIGKGATATLAHRLVDAGALTYDTRVAEIWPGFAKHSKDGKDGRPWTTARVCPACRPASRSTTSAPGPR